MRREAEDAAREEEQARWKARDEEYGARAKEKFEGERDELLECIKELGRELR